MTLEDRRLSSPERPQRIADALRWSYETDVGDTGGFLPDRVPLDRWPAVLEPYLAACRDLPERYQRGRGGVRGWLGRAFAGLDPDVTRCIAEMGGAERDSLMTVLSVLGHAFRWDQVPPADERFDERHIALPAGIALPWLQVARAMDQPRVGSTWSLHLSNWRMTDRPGGSVYRPEELNSENVHVAWNWLLPPVDAHLDRFSVSFVLMEAKGAPVLAHIVAAIEAAADRRVEETSACLDRLRHAIEAMTRTFSMTVRRQTIDPRLWLSLVQPTFAWSAEADTPGRIEGGPSGMQVGVVQALDAALGVAGTSTLAQAALAGRRLMPVRHRRFLGILDIAGPVLRRCVDETDRPHLTERYNSCIRSLVSFRSTHRSRGAVYLGGRPEDGSRRVSTGLTIGVDDDAIEVFDRTSADRALETRQATLPPSP